MNEEKIVKKTPSFDADEELKKLVIERLKTSSDELNVVIGNTGDFTRDELIENVEAGNKIGKEIVESELEFLKAMIEGKIYINE
ncbi:hypothetical protein HYW46_02675 [Candidatus Daviesbacteria bacterium]|nr:hypothetical protein [Candidatus Daviesbacteria bacterium]